MHRFQKVFLFAVMLTGCGNLPETNHPPLSSVPDYPTNMQGNHEQLEIQTELEQDRYKVMKQREEMMGSEVGNTSQ